MKTASRGFQIFVKPAGAACNLACSYCYYLEKGKSGAKNDPKHMPEDLLENYIAQHITASPDEIIRFSWHGGEPTILGVDYFRKIVEIQRRYCPPGRKIANGLQTNGTLLDEAWARFLKKEGFAIGLSLDGPQQIHDRYRLTSNGRPTFTAALQGYEILKKYSVPTDILCVVGAHNVQYPIEIYNFFKEIEATYITFLPLVEKQTGSGDKVTPESVSSEAWGDFLCVIFEEWLARDIGRIKIQIIEEATRVAFGLEHSVCIFRPICGDIPVVERNGDFYCCDHFVDDDHLVGNIRKTPLINLLESPKQRMFGLAKLEKLPRYCRSCDVLEMCYGECPKNRFRLTPDGEPGLNYLCSGYKKFFTRIKPFVEAVAAEWRRQKSNL
ncbi:MAG: anaerobic sulfatase maturase [Candidatus Aminicenantes bacterium]|nr:anaerobic sulfatase maturase [Candidatus Aminicenantes bacterium]